MRRAQPATLHRKDERNESRERSIRKREEGEGGYSLRHHRENERN